MQATKWIVGIAYTTLDHWCQILGLSRTCLWSISVSTEFGILTAQYYKLLTTTFKAHSYVEVPWCIRMPQDSFNLGREDKQL